MSTLEGRPDPSIGTTQCWWAKCDSVYLVQSSRIWWRIEFEFSLIPDLFFAPLFFLRQFSNILFVFLEFFCDTRLKLSTDIVEKRGRRCSRRVSTNNRVVKAACLPRGLITFESLSPNDRVFVAKLSMKSRRRIFRCFASVDGVAWINGGKKQGSCLMRFRVTLMDDHVPASATKYVEQLLGR